MSFPSLNSSNMCPFQATSFPCLLFFFSIFGFSSSEHTSQVVVGVTQQSQTQTLWTPLFIEFITLNQKRHPGLWLFSRCVFLTTIMTLEELDETGREKKEIIGQRHSFLLLSFMERKKIPIFWGGKTKQENKERVAISR